MRNYQSLIYYVVLAALTISLGCTPNHVSKVTLIDTPYVSIEIDTLHLNADLSCSSGFIFNDKIYVHHHSMQSDLAVFDKSGTLVSYSERHSSFWLNNYTISNDTLFNANEKSTHYLNKKTDRFEYFSSRTEAAIFEDDKYKILSTYQIGTGGLLYFIDKDTNDMFRTSARDVINLIRFAEKYYVTSCTTERDEPIDPIISKVVEIEDPSKLQAYKGPTSMMVDKKIELEQSSQYPFDGNLSSGITNIIDTLNIRIIGSFIHKDRLLHMWNENRDYSSSPQKLYLSELIDGKLETRYTFELPMNARYIYSSKENSHLVSFNIDIEYRNSQVGIMIIENDKIRIHMLKCVAES